MIASTSHEASHLIPVLVSCSGQVSIDFARTDDSHIHQLQIGVNSRVWNVLTWTAPIVASSSAPRSTGQMRLRSTTRLIVSTLPTQNLIILTTSDMMAVVSDRQHRHIHCHLVAGRTQVLASPKLVQHPHALSIFEDSMFYSDRRLQKLQVYPKYPNGTARDYPSHTFTKALGVVAVHPVLQPPIAVNPCKSSPCSHLYVE